VLGILNYNELTMVGGIIRRLPTILQRMYLKTSEMTNGSDESCHIVVTK